MGMDQYMMRNFAIRLLAFGVALSLTSAIAADDAKKDKSPLEGTWVIESATAGDMKIEVMGKDKKDVKSFAWTFAGKTYRALVSDGVAHEEGTFTIDVDKSPKHLDLTPTKGEILTTQKCIYSLDGEELKIALTVWFAPGSPEDEIKEAKKMRSTRPTNFNNAKDNPSVVFVLKRKKE
jgi:uncharacterized protein (TIGR03067 family)